MKPITMHMPTELVDELDQRVAQNRFESRSAAIRYYVRSGLQRESKFSMDENNE